MTSENVTDLKSVDSAEVVLAKAVDDQCSAGPAVD